MDFEIIETQEAFDKKVQSLLDENTKTVTEQVKKTFEGYLSPDEVTSKMNEVNSKMDKMKIAYETGLPFELAGKLSGTTIEEIRADAEKLANYVIAKQLPSPQFTAEIPPQDPRKSALLSMLQELKK